MAKKGARKNNNERSKMVVAGPKNLKKEANTKVGEAMNIVMQIPEMVLEILQYLPTCDIKSSNGVNRLWHQEARKLLLKRTKVEFVGFQWHGIDDQIYTYLEEMGEQCHQSVSFRTLVNTANELTAIRALAKKYGNKIQKMCITIRDPEFLRPFLHVKMLTVRLLDHVTMPRDLIMSSVKTLGVDVISTGLEVVNCSLKELTSSLMKMCPQLENLVLHDRVQQAFLTSSQSIDPAKLPKSMITGLKLIGTDYGLSDIENPLKWLFRCPFQLTMLDIDVYDIWGGFLPRPSTSLEEVLCKFSSILKHVKLHYIKCGIWSGESKFIVKFPIMPKLESLQISHVCPSDSVVHRKILPQVKFTFDSCPHGGINYNEQFPLLKNLSIKQVSNPKLPFYKYIGIKVDSTFPCPNPNASIALYNMFFPEGTLPCPTVNHIDVNPISDTDLWYSKSKNCKCGRYCFCDKRKCYYKMLKMMAAVFVNAVELKNFRKSLLSS